MQPSFSSSHVLPLLTWMDRTHQIDIRWVSPFFLGTTVARNELGEPNKHGNSKLALCCLTCHCAWEMAGASRQWQHPHVDIFKTRSGAGSGCRAATRDFDRSGAFLIWTSLMDLNGPMFGSHINARLSQFSPTLVVDGVFTHKTQVFLTAKASARSFGTDASSNSPFPASSLVADVRGDVTEDQQLLGA